MTKKAEGTVARVKGYPLLEALVSRRSRRFAKDMTLNGGPLAYESQIEPEPLTLEEEAALAFAGCGVTGPTLAELPYEGGGKKEAGSGNIIINFVGRTVASAEAVHATVLFVMGDGGAWMLKRPQDYPRAAIPELVRMARDGRFTEFYGKARIKVSGRRPDPPSETAAHGGKSTYERLKAPLERRATGRFLHEARAKVWANTHLMAAARARGDTTAFERLRGELARRSAAKLDELAPEVLLHLWIKGFGVRLDES